MRDILFTAILALFVRFSFTQDEIKRPEFPDVFQTEVEGIFIREKEIVEVDGSLYYDRVKNRAALRFTYKGETSTSIYEFDNDEIISIDGNECVVHEMLDDPKESFFPFTMDGNKKKLAAPEEILFFSNSKLDPEEHSIIPMLVYTVTIDIPAYSRKDCEVIHFFSKPDIERPACVENKLCEPSLLSISVKCKNDKGDLVVDHVYNFYRFTPGIENESIFLPPVGVHCDMKNVKEFPAFTPYFSFTYDIVEKSMDSDLQKAVFSTGNAIWYDKEYNILRSDEFDNSGQLYSSRIFDLSTQTGFTIIARVPSCDMNPIKDPIAFNEVTKLPKVFFKQSGATEDGTVYVGKRKVHGLDYDVWSFKWTDAFSDAMVVEEIYFQLIDPDQDLLPNSPKEPYLQISHVELYTYAKNDRQTYDLTLLKHITINNYRTGPKEWSAFDVSSCFSNKQKKLFILKTKGPPLEKKSQSYGKFLEQLYNNIISATGVSVPRINELTGIFDGLKLQEVRGSILDNSEMAEWQKDKKEPGMEETFKRIQKAAAQGKLTVSFKGENEEDMTFNVAPIEDEVANVTRPEFPDVFQTEVEGIFIKGNETVELDGSLYYDRVNNRAALRLTYTGDTSTAIYDFNSNEIISIAGETSTAIYDFNSDEIISIAGDECDVNDIPDDPLEAFFPFTMDGEKKKLAAPEEILFFSKSKLDHQELSTIPVFVYSATIDIPQYEKTNCDVLHFFSKPDVERPTCIESELCDPSLLTITVKCKNAKGDLDVNHVYNFYRFTPGIKDESIFLPSAGVHCDMKNVKEFPAFPPYFSFSFDTVEKPMDSALQKAVFSRHKEVWYDAEYKIIRIDEFDYSGLLYSSRILDLTSKIAFTIATRVSTCDMGPITDNIAFDEATRLPKIFFAQNDSTAGGAIYVGKRKVHGLDYDVWSFEWTVSDARIVEEIYFQQITPDQNLFVNTTRKPDLEISHVDIYTYEEDEERNYELTLLKHVSINNYRTGPKEWSAFDVATCFSNKEKKVFILKIKGPPLVKESQSYREVLELLYNNIISATGVSVFRINELAGVFDGVELQEARGSILDNSEILEWQKDNKEPGMDETFKNIQKAAAEGKLTVYFKGENGEDIKFTITTVEEEIEDVKSSKPDDCYSGVAMAAVSIVLLVVGIFFGVSGYYVFLKKRRIAKDDSALLMQSVKS